MTEAGSQDAHPPGCRAAYRALCAVPAACFIGAVPGEDQLRRYYDESNLDRYRTPEQVQASYLLLDASSLGGLVDVEVSGRGVATIFP